MATLATRLSDLATRIATECKSIRTLLNGNAADLSALQTTAKTNLVAAINEVNAKPSGATINDSTTAVGSTWSSTKIAAERAAVKAEILGAAGAAYDTLEELKAYADSGQAADQVALGNRVRFDASQTLTAPQKAQAKTNIDAYGNLELGNPDTDLVAVFNAALV